MVQIQTKYLGDLHCEAEHMPSANKLVTDAPKDNRGRGEAFSPTDLIATSLGTCIATILGIQAQDLDLDLKGMQVTVEKHMAEGPRRISRLVTNVWMPVALEEDLTDRLERAARGCPVHHSIHPDIETPIVFHWPAEETADAAS